jgi:hypothetical protein
MAQNPIKLPPGFELETEETQPTTQQTVPNLPPGFELETRHGATGSFEDVAPLDVAQRFQRDYPVLSSPLTALARFGKGAVESVTETAKGIYSAATEPRRPDETAPAGTLTAKRLIVDPMREQQRKSAEADTGLEAFGHGLAGVIPVIGPMAAGLTEQAVGGELPEALGGLALGAISPQLLKEYKLARGMRGKGPALPAPITEQSVSTVSTMIESGVKNDLVNSYAEQSIPIWRQAAAELGKTPEQFPVSTAPVTVPFTRIGPITEGGKRAVRSGGEHAIEIADHAVRIADRPFKDVLRQHGKLSIEPVGVPPHMTVKAKIVASLESALADASDNPPLAKALRERIRQIQETKDFNGLQSLKEIANNKTESLFSKSLGQQINASVEPINSWRVMGDAIRADMYPELARISGVDLSKAGRLEGVVMDARDGLRQHFYKDVLNPHNRRMQQTYWEYVRDGSLARRSMIKRALMLEPTPAGQFNTQFMRGIGEIPPMPGTVPYNPRGSFNFAPKTVTGTEQQLIPHVPPTGAAPLFEPPQGFSKDIGQAIFGVQQRANQAARMAPPPTVTGTQSIFGERSTPQHTGQPGRPGEFFPGKRGVKRETTTEITGYDSKGNPITEPVKRALDYRQQQQLFGIQQTAPRFNPMERTNYTNMELRSLLKDTVDFIQSNPNHPDVQLLRQNLQAVRDELIRRATKPAKKPSGTPKTPGVTSDSDLPI